MMIIIIIMIIIIVKLISIIIIIIIIVQHLKWRLACSEYIYLHITFGSIGSIQQSFISSPFNWKTALKIKNLSEQFNFNVN